MQDQSAILMRLELRKYTGNFITVSLRTSNVSVLWSLVLLLVVWCLDEVLVFVLQHEITGQW